MVSSLGLAFGRAASVADLQRLRAHGLVTELLDGALLVSPSPYTVDELQELPDDGHRYELVDGDLFVTPAPNLRHQSCVVQLVLAFSAELPDDCFVLPAPFEFRISPRTELQPDVLVVRKADVDDARLQRAPALLVAEVLSRSTRRMDLERKKALYAEAGVAHYWVVDPLDAPRCTVIVHRLRDGAYDLVAQITGGDELVVDQPHPIRVTPERLLPRW